MTTIQNPILRGFNPDPSILRVGDDYYIATSTFEWYPGVQIHHSRDLVHWRLLTRPLRRASQLDMRGDPDSCGIWAPCLTHADGLFHLVYTDVKRYGRTSIGGVSNASLRDFHNYMVTADRIDGNWSEPVYLNSSGFDPSLFHDEDGRKYLLNMLWDHRPGQTRFAGIVLQEYSPRERKLVGQRRVIFRGTSIGFTEAPHLYRHGGYYHLMVAEGGTFWGHAVTMARSQQIDGPYELHPDTYILTARDRPDRALQRAGHGSLVQAQDGQTYMAYLCGRPLPNRGRCVLGRETAIQQMVWSEDGWLRTADGQGVPQVSTPAPNLTAHPFPAAPAREDFDSTDLPIDFQWLRSPYPERLWSLSERPGFLRLFGRETLGSPFEQALVARRQQAQCFSASTRMEFQPEHFQQAAGLMLYYHATKFHYLFMAQDETAGRHLRVMSCTPDVGDSQSAPIPLPSGTGNVELRMDVDYDRLIFAWRLPGQTWHVLPQVFDASIVSDECGPPTLPNFTGAFAGVCCQDGAGTRRPADFDYFEYRERDYQVRPVLG
ncbi:MAG: glycoside hydrolase family 43 protein [Tepidisphaeraceae bacterium]|jgi:xylan 1,4-beta-xylosidase